MPPYIPATSHDWVFADLEDPYPPTVTSLPVEATLATPDDDDPQTWVPAVWHPDKAATVVMEYEGNLPVGWYYFWSRVNTSTKYRHGKIRLI